MNGEVVVNTTVDDEGGGTERQRVYDNSGMAWDGDSVPGQSDNLRLCQTLFSDAQLAAMALALGAGALPLIRHMGHSTAC